MARAYNALLHAMAWLAGLLMAVMMTSIVVDVVLRNAGSQSSAHIFTFNEYFLLLIPLLGAPLLVREKGHVYVEVLLMQFGGGARKFLNTLILLICVLTCLILTGFSAEIAVTDFIRNELDIRSLDMPRWMLTSFMPLSFALMAVEFGRFLVRGEDPYSRADGGRASH
ncbi:MAG: TRAP transporter small permease subunit [Burkholderiaceae bacterium]